MGRVGRSDAEWSRRVLLAENLNARVVTDQKVAASFPTDHALHAGMSEVLPGSGIQDVLRAADVLLSLDWVDLGGTLNSVRQGAPESAGQTVISCSLDPMLHKGAIKDHFEPAPVNINVLADPDLLVSALLERRHGDATPPRCEDPPLPRKATTTPTGERSRSETNLSLTDIAEALDDLLVGHSHSLVRLPLRWPSSDIHVSAPLDNLGGDGGGGIGAGPSMAIGSSLGLLRTDRLPVAVLGDGDFLMGATALWTAAHYGIPLLVVVANNRSFFNDERHQELVAQSRGRPVENRWLGQHIRDPDPDISGLARSLGADGYGPITSAAELREAFKHGIDRVTAGGVVVIDARIMGA